eukprot:403361476
MSDQSIANNSEKIDKTTKIAVFGVSASVIALFSYYLYSKYVKAHRNHSSSSDSDDDAKLFNSLKKNGALKSSSPSKLNKQRYSQRTGLDKLNTDQQIRKQKQNQSKLKNAKCSCADNKTCEACLTPQKNKNLANQQNNESEANLFDENEESSENSLILESGQLDKSLWKNNGRMRGTAHNRGRKIVYFDSNDEMVYGSEISLSDDEDSLKNGKNQLQVERQRNRQYAKVFVQATEDERKRIREMIAKQKQKKIQLFLQEVNDKKGKFLHQKKMKYKEDNIREIINAEVGPDSKSQGSRTSSTQSDEYIRQNPKNLRNLNQSRQNKYLKEHNHDMQQYLNQNRNFASQNLNGNQASGVIPELSSKDFQDKDRHRWFDLFSLYTQNFMQENEKNEKYRKRQQLERYYTSTNNNQNKKRSASME